MKTIEYSSLPDQDLAALHVEGDEHALPELLSRYMSFILKRAQLYRGTGMERDDFVQEGVLGLLSAVRHYDGKRKASFRTYAGLCIERKIYTAYKNATRKKHTPLNRSVSLDGEMDETLHSILIENPEDQYISEESVRQIKRYILENLTDTEKTILNLYLSGLSYAKIADKLSVTTKYVDNCLQRIRRKMKNNMDG